MGIWTHQGQNAAIEDVYQPLADHAKGQEHPWSIVELRLSDEDVRWLNAWLQSFSMPSWDNDHLLMLGGILLCAGAELCREKSTEDSVWTAMRSLVSESLRKQLFLSNGQPSSITKGMITRAARALNLRNAMDVEGTQQWFLTIKLQFGFTYRGAKNRLAEWLVNIGRPQAIHYLTGNSDFPDLASLSFQSTWRALVQYRRGLIDDKSARQALLRSPWIRPEWANDLLKEARARIETLGREEVTGRATSPAEAGLHNEELCPVASMSLEWAPGTNPRLKLKLDCVAIENAVVDTDISELDFYIDSKKLCRWRRQQDGSWAKRDSIYAEPEEQYRLHPNLNPRVLSIQSGTGQPVIDWDLSDSGFDNEVMLFDLDRESVVDLGYERLEANRQYAVICDKRTSLQGCAPVQAFQRDFLSRKVLKLPKPLSENICISFEDFVLWQPVRPAGDSRLRFPLSLTTLDTLSLNDKAQLVVEGLPTEARVARLLINTKRHLFADPCSSLSWKGFLMSI